MLILALRAATDSELVVVKHVTEEARETLIRELRSAELGEVHEALADSETFPVFSLPDRYELKEGDCLVIHTTLSLRLFEGICWKLNMAREFLFDLGCRLILCLRPQEFKLFARKALDLFNWRLGVFDLGDEARRGSFATEPLVPEVAFFLQDDLGKRSHSELEKTIAFYKQQLENLKSETKPDPVSRARAGIQLGRANLELGKPNKSLKYFRDVLAVEGVDEKDFADALVGESIAFCETGKFQEALETAQDAVRMYTLMSLIAAPIYLVDLGKSLSVISLCFALLGNETEAWEAAHSAIEAYEKLRESSEAIYGANLGEIWLGWKNLFFVAQLYRDSIPDFRKIEIAFRNHSLSRARHKSLREDILIATAFFDAIKQSNRKRKVGETLERLQETLVLYIDLLQTYPQLLSRFRENFTQSLSSYGQQLQAMNIAPEDDDTYAKAHATALELGLLNSEDDASTE